jgi:transposase-like protein
VTKRWTLWKHQLEAGMSTSEIARHWGCHHTSIINAKKRNFTARKSTGRVGK